MHARKKILLSFSLVISAIVPSKATGNQEVFSQEKPNVLILMADDMGYGELGCYGGAADTPNLDKLAQKGIKFTQFYAAAPNCSPSRAALLTGKAPSITGIYNYRPANHPMHLRKEEISLAELLKEEGYQTALFGKWHLGCLPQDEKLNHPQPENHGFDYYFATENNAEPSHHNPVNFIRNGKRLGQLSGYSCQIVADEAISWIENHHKRPAPFFMYVAFHEPHASTQRTAPPELKKNYSHYPEREANCFANVQNLDSAAGRILTHLIDNDLFDNTIIVFASDNGSYRSQANGGLKAVKSYLYEGGIRVPGIIHWSGFKNKPGFIIEEPAGLIDILPTVCNVLDVKLNSNENLDGTSILTLLKEKEFNREKPLFWFFYRTTPEIALRAGDFIIMGKDNDRVPRTHSFSAHDMAYIKTLDLQDYELYDLRHDQSQTKNILNVSPQKEHYIKLINKKLKEIQNKGYRWTDLPSLENQPKRIKTKWVIY